MRRNMVLIVVLLLVLGLAAPVGAASDSRPFEGTLSGSVGFFPFTPGCDNYDGFDLVTAGTGEGNASHMGRTEMTSAHCTPDEGVADVTGGDMTLVAANGDEVFIAYEGVAPPPGPDGIIVVDLEFEIVGGTGRFADAHGGGDMTAFVVFEGFDDFEWAASWVWKGRIGY